jgi:hypothetical protein
MMNKKQAIKLAQDTARKQQREMVVVYDSEYDELYGKDEAYAVCSEYTFDTHYHMEKAIYVATP